VAGELDWLAAGLPTDGGNAELPRAGDLARPDVPTCRLDEPIGQVRERVRAAGWDACVVVNDQRVVLGLLRAGELGRGQEEPVEQVMRPGPSTFRPHVPIEELAHFMIHHDLPTSPVTTSDGRLVGLLRREDAARVALEQTRGRHDEHDEHDEHEVAR
jgi:Mg/Co/Ni transporter MgtE